MATRFACIAGLSLLLMVGLLGIAGCEDSGGAADANLPPPSFVAYTPPPRPVYLRPITPAPAPQPVAVAPRPAPITEVPIRRYNSNGFIVPASWIPHVAPRPWQWIIIHHTATTFGNAAIVTRWHIDRGFDEMGYHFLIGNGTNSGDGQVEVGTRWPKQKWGAHTKTPDNRFNDYGIGICLVGNFDIQYPSAAQMRSVERLVAYLMRTYHIPPDHVLGHNDCKSTDCPGKHLSVAIIRRAAVRILADDGYVFPAEPRLAAGEELIHDVK
ncbi:MAG TPA: peptidoglycan recognition family protein [Tepidisphaeraceae bacterium]|nr:peptidoglycan recognition family protein [Tepidisphaeraceae bacterium]